MLSAFQELFSGEVSFSLFFWCIWFISICLICVWIGTVTGLVTLPLREALAINFIHVSGEGNHDCSNEVRVFPIKGKSESGLSLKTS